MYADEQVAKKIFNVHVTGEGVSPGAGEVQLLIFISKVFKMNFLCKTKFRKFFTSRKTHADARLTSAHVSRTARFISVRVQLEHTAIESICFFFCAVKNMRHKPRPEQQIWAPCERLQSEFNRSGRVSGLIMLNFGGYS